MVPYFSSPVQYLQRQTQRVARNAENVRHALGIRRIEKQPLDECWNVREGGAAGDATGGHRGGRW